MDGTAPGGEGRSPGRPPSNRGRWWWSRLCRDAQPGDEVPKASLDLVPHAAHDLDGLTGRIVSSQSS